ncbi:hypothetical protein [Reyranella sp. CPCC 100927]|uniref:hypothetical protein n=1 Tax=Reyranella sp. CPCC 100927 TaxID=2599616 RepID=UPI0011B68AF5|nr:hypothetical protein [Reyranella sp. CPCC 100927]TWS94992.1 hypothetical protein FQU96_40805 [Reyranella sp. CPCC 100927]
MAEADTRMGQTGRADYSKPIATFLAELGRNDPARVIAMAAEAGLQARKADGDVIVSIPGRGTMRWAVAVRQKLIPLRVG